MTDYGGVGVRTHHNQEVEWRDAPTPTPAPLTLPDLDPRYVAGCALVARMGSFQEVSAMTGNREEVQEINRNTRAWLAEQQRRAA